MPDSWWIVAAWIVSPFLFFQIIAWFARRWRLAWFLLLLYLPAFVVARRTIIDSRYKNSVVSCANHSGIYWSFYNHDSSQRLPDSTEFQDLLTAFWGTQWKLYGARCPGYRLAGSKTGVIYVGGGLHLDSLREHQVLVAFCSSLSHPPPYDHQHCSTWKWSSDNDKYPGVFGRECTDTTGMVQKIEFALKQAASGQVPYSSAAQDLLRSELAARKAMAHLSAAGRAKRFTSFQADR